jgi:hypothetical protein
VQLVLKILSANLSFCRFVCFGQGVFKFWGFNNDLRVSVNVVANLTSRALIDDKTKTDRM